MLDEQQICWVPNSQARETGLWIHPDARSPMHRGRAQHWAQPAPRVAVWFPNCSWRPDGAEWQENCRAHPGHVPKTVNVILMSWKWGPTNIIWICVLIRRLFLICGYSGVYLAISSSERYLYVHFLPLRKVIDLWIFFNILNLTCKKNPKHFPFFIPFPFFLLCSMNTGETPKLFKQVHCHLRKRDLSFS